MRPSALLVAMILWMSACGLVDMGEMTHSNNDGVWISHNWPDPLNVCYVTALDYRNGYDWRTDKEKGTVKCSLIMYADSVPLLKIPVGSQYEVSSDPQRHRVIDGHLYTDYTDGTTTVMKKDGKELFRYGASETVDDVLSIAGQLHTLSRPATGAGFSYRIDGEPVVERITGSSLGYLTSNKGTVSFCFAHEVMTEGGIVRNYYRVTGGNVSKVDLPEGVSGVWDMIVKDGCVYMIVSFDNESIPCLLYDTTKERLSYFGAAPMLSCKFIKSDSICLTMRYMHGSSGFMSDVLWLGPEKYHLYRTGCTLSSVYVDANGSNATINSTENEDGLIFKGTRVYDMPVGYAVNIPSSIVRNDSTLFVGLMSQTGRNPILWKDGTMDTLNVNGYITSLSMKRH